MTDPAAMTPDVDALVKTVREAHSKAMEALGADALPYSAIAIRDWEEALDTALSDLAARVRDKQIRVDAWVGEAVKSKDRARSAEADRDRLARRIAELEAVRQAAENYLRKISDPMCPPVIRQVAVDALDDALRLAGDGGGA